MDSIIVFYVIRFYLFISHKIMFILYIISSPVTGRKQLYYLCEVALEKKKYALCIFEWLKDNAILKYKPYT